jgi:hypothetical protein
MIVGDMLRDWRGFRCDSAIFLYDPVSFQPVSEDRRLPVFRHLWSFRTNLSNSKMFGGKTKVQTGLRWYEYGRLTYNKLATPLSIAFAFVATHNHFVLDRGGKVFNRTAPIIKLPAETTENDHLKLLGLLNSSTGCFWLKQTLFDRGGGGIGGGLATENWERFYDHVLCPIHRLCRLLPFWMLLVKNTSGFFPRRPYNPVVRLMRNF